MAGTTTCRSCIRALRSVARPQTIEISSTSYNSFIHLATLPSLLSPSRSIRRPYTAKAQTPSAPIPSTSAAAPVVEGSPGSAAPTIALPTVDNTTTEETSEFAETYVAKDKAEILFKECARQADYVIPQVFERDGDTPKNADGEEIGEGVGWWYESCGLEPTFNIWFQITALHLYLLTARLRYLPPSRSEIWQQHLSNAFFYEAEHRMTLFHRISSRAIRNRYLKDLYNQWRGVQGAYDEGLVRGDAVLAAAVWRNVFKGAEDVDWRKVAQIVSYMRRGLRGLDRTSEDTVLRGRIKFAGPGGEDAVVEREAKGVEMVFGKEDESALTELEAKLAKS